MGGEGRIFLSLRPGQLVRPRSATPFYVYSSVLLASSFSSLHVESGEWADFVVPTCKPPRRGGGGRVCQGDPGFYGELETWEKEPLRS